MGTGSFKNVIKKMCLQIIIDKILYRNSSSDYMPGYRLIDIPFYIYIYIYIYIFIYIYIYISLILKNNDSPQLENVSSIIFDSWKIN